MNGLDASTGRPMSGPALLRRYIVDVLTTPIGTRVARRDYGSLLPELVDHPAHKRTRIRLYAATALAIARWLPMLRLTRVYFEAAGEQGAFLLSIDAFDRTQPAPNNLVRLTVPLRFGHSRPATAVISPA